MKTKITLIMQTFLVLLFSTVNSYSQTNPTVSLAQSPACTYAGCNAKDLEITNSFIGKSDGTPLDVCDVGDATTAYLFIKVNTGPKYNIYVQFDLYWNDVKVNTTGKYSYAEPVTGTEIPRIPINISEINFSCGGKLELKNIYVSWKTNGDKGVAAGCASASVGSKCTESGLVPNIIVNTPLAVDFSYNKSCVGGGFEQIVFTNTSTGGDGILTYLWNFGAGATPPTSTASGKSPSPITVTYSSGGSKNISLKITDNDGDFNTELKTITVGACCTIAINSIVKTNVQCNGSSNGTVTATKTGGVGTITYDLLFSATSGGSFTATGLPTNGDSNGTYTGLGVGFYKVVVSEVNGCSNTSSEVQITQPILVTVSGIATNATCFGEANGSIAVTNSAGSTVVITNAQNQVVSNTGLVAGTYTLTASAPNGNANGSCTATAQVTITQPAVAVSVSGIATNATCF
ncbi:PKD domain-containing protein, partial [Flavobacterium sp. LB2P84]|uniref:PKD domain-containing protein n=1 Tax=Flavobacterium yafengii TaxID=3041253 RepID=UPI0024A9E9DE